MKYNSRETEMPACDRISCSEVHAGTSSMWGTEEGNLQLSPSCIGRWLKFRSALLDDVIPETMRETAIATSCYRRNDTKIEEWVTGLASDWRHGVTYSVNTYVQQIIKSTAGGKGGFGALCPGPAGRLACLRHCVPTIPCCHWVSLALPFSTWGSVQTQLKPDTWHPPSSHSLL